MAEERNQKKSKNALKVGENIVRTMKLSNGMKITFDVYQNAYTKYCYDNKKYAFLSDYARLLIVYFEGGIYYDTDVEVIKPINDLLKNKAFVGFEVNEYINTGIGFGAEKDSSAIKLMINEYDKLLDGKSGTVDCPILNTEAIKN